MAGSEKPTPKLSVNSTEEKTKQDAEMNENEKVMNKSEIKDEIKNETIVELI